MVLCITLLFNNSYSSINYSQNNCHHSMKSVLTILLLFSSTYLVSGQSYSFAIDSLTNLYIKQLPETKRGKFDKILNQRISVDFFNRFDSTKFDYAFIEETYCETDTTTIINERYFFKTDSQIVNISSKIHQYTSLPRISFFNGKRYNSGHNYFSNSVAGTFFDNIYEYYYTLDTLLKNYSNLNPIQELTYDNTPAIHEISDTTSTGKLKLEKRLIQKLSKTYQILSFIDYSNKKVLVSIQFPPVKPNVNIRFVNIIAYDW
jgi:hypothetical protein